MYIIFESYGRTYRMDTISGKTWVLDLNAWKSVQEVF